MSNDIPYLGSKISLISKAEIRYEGVLYSIDANESTVALAKVRSFGTEDRHTDHPVQPRDEIFEYIIFRGTDIKDLHVCDTNKLTPQDPAIVQSSMSSSQINSIGSNNVYPFGGGPPPPPSGSYSAQQMPGQYPPYNAFGGHQGYQSHSNYQGSHSQFSGAPSTHSDSRSPSPPPQQLPQSLTNSNAASINVGGPNDYSPAILDERTRGGANRGGAYNRGRYNDYPQGSQQMAPPSQQHQQPPQQQNYINREYVRSDYQQRQQQQQQRQQPHHSYLNNRENGPSNIRYNKENYPSQYQPSTAQHHQQQQQYRDSSSPSHQQQQQRGYPPNNNNVSYMKSSPGNAQQQQQHDYRLQRGRGPTRGYFNNTSNMRLNRGGGGGHMMRGSSRGYGGRPGYMRFGRPGVLKFDSEFDFESSNAQFDKCQIEKELKEKLKIESKDQSLVDDSTAVDGEGDDVNGGEVGQSGHSAYYDKNKSFFDSISCEALDTNGSAARTNWREERKLNFETFGLRSSNGFRGRYRGRGGSYSRGYGGMDNGYHSNRGVYGGYRGGDRSWANQYSRGANGGRGYRGGSGGAWNKQQQQQSGDSNNNRIVESNSLNNNNQSSTVDK